MATKAKTKANQFETYKDALRKKQQEMLDLFDRDRAGGNAAPDDGIQDLADKAASAYSKELNFSLSDAERITLVQIEEALDRTENGQFGICTNCGVTIGEKRLIAIPWTPFCIDCQEQQEKGLL
jgi:DnaK suppressor protein